MEDTWASRDLPVLDAIVRILEDQHDVWGNRLAEVTEFDDPAVARALKALDGGGYIVLHRSWGTDARSMCVKEVTAAARQAVGQWPTPESLVEQLAAAFAEAADAEPDDEKKSRLRQVAGFLTSTGRDVATDIVSKVILRSAGME